MKFYICIENESGYNRVLDGVGEVEGMRWEGWAVDVPPTPSPHLDYQSINNNSISTILISNDQVQIKTA